MLQSSYAYIGGIKGDEFKTPETMLSVAFWKLVIRDGKVTTCRMYKDHAGRKSIASGTDGTPQGKKDCAEMMKADFERSYTELSGAAEGFVKKMFPDLYKKFAIPADQVGKLIGKEVHPESDGIHYTRKIGGEDHVKICLGTPGKQIITY